VFGTPPPAAAPEIEQIERHRPELTGYCYRMLASPFEAEDAVQETMLRAWRSIDRFEGRAALRSWLYKIATNVCLDMLSARGRRATPMDLGPAREPIAENLATRGEATWVEPIRDDALGSADDPAELAMRRETIRLAFVAALQHLPPRQRTALILCEVLRWKAGEVAELLETSTASVNSALQRARETVQTSEMRAGDVAEGLAEPEKGFLERYVAAFEAYDMDALRELIAEDASQSMPPYDLWLQGREDVLAWWVGPGLQCRGSRLLRAPSANGCIAYGQYKPDPEGGHAPWALKVLEMSGDGRIGRLTFFLDTERLFPLFALPAHLP
jgi:RNA polymerase sigma-70 factor (ECF subfamily)